jgi:hypothetical protein
MRSTALKMDRNGRDWSGVFGDALWLFVLFVLWTWQFETSAAGSLYHSVLAAIGFICLVGVGVLVAAMLVGILLSHVAR